MWLSNVKKDHIKAFIFKVNKKWAQKVPGQIFVNLFDKGYREQ